MSRSLAVMWLGLFLVLAAGVCSASSSQVDANELRTYIDGVVADAMQREPIAGVSVAVIDRSGVLFTKGYGVAALHPARSMASGTLCRVGSISKSLVWIALMQLAEQGKLKLDDPINQHLPPQLQIPDEGFSEPIRIHHLMTHSAGFEESILGHMEVDDANRELPLVTYLARYRPHRVRPPGELAVYSNYSAALAGVIVAHTSGMSWEDYAETRIMRPLGMLTSTYREAIPPELARQHGLPQPASPAVASMMSAGFRWLEGRLEEAPPEYITHYAPAGALAASANDMARYMQALLDPDGLVRAGVLNAQSVHTMLEPSFANAKGFGTIYHGFFQFPFPGSSSAFGHDGDTRYQHAIMMIVPDVGVGIFIGVNTASGLRLVERLPYLVGLHLQGQNAPRTAVANTGAPDRRGSAALAGTYRPFRRAYFRTERFFLNLVTASVEATGDGDLLVSGLSDEGVVRYRPLGHEQYQELTGLQRIAFRHSRSGLQLLDPTGSNPLERITFWQGPAWLLLIVALTHVVALWGSIQLLREGRSALRLLSLAWLLALALAWIAMMPWLSDTEALVMSYPGVLFPLACWLFFVAALGTLALALFLIAKRPSGWSAWRWAGTGAALLIFVSCAITLRYWGALGFSGW
jgi:CubicO group peptidase (beta-lactamase class C family)